MARKSSGGSKNRDDYPTQGDAVEKSTSPEGASGYSTRPRIKAEEPAQISATRMSVAPAGTSGHSTLRRLAADLPTRVG
jgi:hypothetical protein